MVNLDKIKSLAKEQGKKLSYLTSQIGVPHTYFADLNRHKRDMPLDRLKKIADLLGTTVEFLRDETDDPAPKQKKPAAISDELWNMMQNDAFAVEFLEGYFQLNNEQRAELKAIWKRIIDEQHKY